MLWRLWLLCEIKEIVSLLDYRMHLRQKRDGERIHLISEGIPPNINIGMHKNLPFLDEPLVQL